MRNTLVHQLKILYCVTMNHSEAHLMVSSREVGSKVLRMVIYLKVFLSKKKKKDKMANVMIEILDFS